MFHSFFTSQLSVTKNKIICKKLQHFLINKYDLCQKPPSPPPPIHTFLLFIFSLLDYLYNPPNRWVHSNRTHQMDGYILIHTSKQEQFKKNIWHMNLMNTPHELLPHGVYSKKEILYYH